MPGTPTHVPVLGSLANFLYVVTLPTLLPRCMKLLKLVYLFRARNIIQPQHGIFGIGVVRSESSGIVPAFRER